MATGASRCSCPVARPSSRRSSGFSIARDLRVETLQLHQPSLDDVFLAQTGRKLEGSGAGAEDEDGAAEPAPKGRRGRRRRGR